MGTRRRLTAMLQDQRGSILLLSLVLVFVMTMLGAALFDLAVVEHRLVIEDRQDAYAFHAAEAGLYRGYRDLSDAGGTNDLPTVFAACTSSPCPSQSWTGYTSVAFGGAGAGYALTATPVFGSAPKQVKLSASGCVPATDPCPSTNNSAFLQALVTQTLSLTPNTAVFGAASVSFSGGGTATDSYDSSKGAYNALLAGGAYNIGNNGGIGTNGTVLVHGKIVGGNITSTTNTPSNPDVNINGGAVVNGNVTSGGTVQVTSSTVTGTITRNSASPPIVYPPVSACGPPYSSGAGMTWTGNPSTYVPTSGALTVTGNQTLTLANGSYCFSSMALGNGGIINVSGPVVIKLTGPLNFTGGTVANSTQKAENLEFLSSVGTGPPNYSDCSNALTTGLTFGNGTATYAVVYAPGAGITLSGNTDVFGAVVSNGVCNPSGSAKVHYDEAIARSNILAGGLPSFTMASWKRCNNASCT